MRNYGEARGEEGTRQSSLSRPRACPRRLALQVMIPPPRLSIACGAMEPIEPWRPASYSRFFECVNVCVCESVCLCAGGHRAARPNQDLSGFRPYGFRAIITHHEGVTCSDLD